MQSSALNTTPLKRSLWWMANIKAEPDPENPPLVKSGVLSCFAVFFFNRPMSFDALYEH